MRRSTTLLVAAVTAAVVGTGATALVGPRPPTLEGAPTTGDAALATDALDALGPSGVRGAAVALVDMTAPAGARVRLAALGTTAGDGSPAVGATTPFETGSVAKALDGLLLADMVEAGEVSLDERVGDLVPGTELGRTGDAPVVDLATHRSGLPRLPGDMLVTTLVTRYTGGDPYDQDPAEVLAAAGGAGAPGGAEPSYSNLGAAALGQALAERAGTSWPQLLAERVLEPVGMAGTTVATSTDELPAGRAQGVAANGRRQEPWVAAGWAPAGVGTWSSAQDLATLATALLDGTAPGAAALDPVAGYTGEGRIGLHWITTDVEAPDGTERAVTWHNGGTGGTSTFLGLDREAGRAVVLLATTDRSVDAAALELLVGAP